MANQTFSDMNSLISCIYHVAHFDILPFLTDMRKCNFCANTSDGDKFLLKLKPSMLTGIGIKSDLEYYACEEHFEVEAIRKGKRRRWAQDARLNVTIEDIKVDPKINENVKCDHNYSKHLEIDDQDYSECAIDLNMGKDYFCDSQSISCREEVFEENDDSENIESQVNYAFKFNMKCS